MHLKQWKTGLAAAGLMLTTQFVYATAMPAREQVQLPQCLAAKLSIPYELLAENKNYKIIELDATQMDRLAQTADEVACGRFVNLTHKFGPSLHTKPQTAQQLLKKPTIKTVKGFTSYSIQHQDAVKAALSQVNSNNIWQTLTHMTSYYNRSATKDTGVETAQWLKSEFEKMATDYGREDTHSYFVETGYYKQPSLVTVIGKDLQAPAIVLGAHMDTLDGRMPGAGDDGSGSSSAMEAARVLLSSTIDLQRPVYIIWYAAEERGLVGSQYVVEDFMRKAIPVHAALQLDMTGFRNDMNDPTIWVYKDYTDKDLNNFLTDLIKTYVQVPVAYSRCGYGCSDHASWMAEGIPAAFPCETSFEEHNPYIHSSADSMDRLSLEHMTNFSKLALAFVIELAAA